VVLNLADMGTRPTVLPRDMGPGTLYPWMRDPPEAWPTKKNFSQPLSEKCRKDVLSVAGMIRVAPNLWYPPRADTRGNLERIYGYVYKFLARVRSSLCTSRLRGQ
jgi:hypothetical protein